MRPEIAIVGLALCAALAGPSEAKAQVVALGASNTRGYDLPLQDAWPAKLEALLRQRGYNVAVSNEGINGDTSEGMLSRVGSAVPVGTRVVVLECCGNDNKDGRHQVADHDGNIRSLVRGLKARGVAVVYWESAYRTRGTTMRGSPSPGRLARPGADGCSKAYRRITSIFPRPATTQMPLATT